MEKTGSVIGLLQDAFNEIGTLKIRATSVEERLANVEEANLELKEKVARLERLQVRRRSIDLKEPGDSVSKLKRS